MNQVAQLGQVRESQDELPLELVGTIPCRPFPLTQHVLAVRLYAPIVPKSTPEGGR